MSHPTDVLRGMEVHGVPLRLLRERRTEMLVGIAAQARAEDDIRRKGFEEGREAGWNEGLRAGQEEGRRIAQQELTVLLQAEREKLATHAAASLRPAQEQAALLVASLGAAMQDCVAAAEDELVALCFECVCALLGSCALEPERIREQVRSSAVTWCKTGEAIAVRLNPQDAALLADATAGWPPTVRCHPDPDVAHGGCIVVGSRGGLDLRLDTMLERLKETLLRVRASRATKSGAAP